jgi:hypothetical protein
MVLYHHDVVQSIPPHVFHVNANLAPAWLVEARWGDRGELVFSRVLLLGLLGLALFLLLCHSCLTSFRDGHR